MFIFETYDDGSISYGYETGDQVRLAKAKPQYTLNGHLMETIQAGSLTTVNRVREYGKQFGYYTTEATFIDYIGASDLQPTKETLEACKDSPPTQFAVLWREGKLDKASYVWAWSEDEAKEKLVARIRGYRGSAGSQERIDGITWLGCPEAKDIDKSEYSNMGVIGY